MAIVRFLFFLPPPGADLGGGSGLVGFGVGTREAIAGVAEFRVVETITTGSGTTLSALGAKALDAKEAEECAAVACIAFIRRELFCCLLGTPDGLEEFCLVEGSDKLSAVLEADSSWFLLASSASDGSVTGHTNPVRGV